MIQRCNAIVEAEMNIWHPSVVVSQVGQQFDLTAIIVGNKANRPANKRNATHIRARIFCHQLAQQHQTIATRGYFAISSRPITIQYGMLNVQRCFAISGRPPSTFNIASIFPLKHQKWICAKKAPLTQAVIRQRTIQHKGQIPCSEALDQLINCGKIL